ncbi:MAG: N-acetyltransferase [Chloroflexi bacterium]|nr:N-acetyltransferase [Chloroflexota bacterium]
MSDAQIAQKLAELATKDRRLERARIADVPQLHTLINYFADQGDLLHRSMSELYENVRDFIVVKEGEKVVACASLHVNWEDVAEIKSVAVSTPLQGQGIGALLIEQSIEDAVDLGLKRVFVLTHKPGFYERLGFQRADVLSFPRKVWSECIRCPKFPSCNEIAMDRPVDLELSEPLPSQE